MRLTPEQVRQLVNNHRKASMVKTGPLFPIIFLAGIVFTIFAGINYGAAGVIASIMLTVFALGGVSSILFAGPYASIGYAFIWFIGLIIVIVSLFLGEYCLVDDGAVPGKHFGVHGDYLADKVCDTLVLWYNKAYTVFNISGLHLIVLIFVMCFVIGFLNAALRRK